MNTIIFEDNFIASMSLKIMMERVGGIVLGMFESADDLSMIENGESIDCILMDIQLKGEKSGLDATEELRRYSKTPVLFISGNNSSEVLQRMKTLNNTYFLGKPFTEKSLFKKLHEMNLIKP